MLKELIEKSKSYGIKEIEILSTKTIGLSISVYNQKVDKCVKSEVESLIIRGIYRKKQGKIVVENLDPSQYDFYLKELVNNAKMVTSTEPAIIYKGAKHYRQIKEKPSDLVDHSTYEKQELLLNIEKQILAGKNVKTVESTVYNESSAITRLINSKGLDLSKKTGITFVYSIGVFEKNKDIQTSFDYQVGRNFNEFDPAKLAKNIIKVGNAKLGGEPVDTGEYDIVFERSVVGDLLSAFSSCFTAESAYRQVTLLKDKVGEVVASNIVSLVDDPYYSKSYENVSFDNEGVPCKTRSVIKDGVFTGFINNLKYANILKQKPTGNGFGGGISFTNPILKPGHTSLNNILKEVGNGLYITGLDGLHAGINVQSGSFSLQSEGFVIKNGKLGKAVRLIVLSGNFFDILKSVKTVGNDLKYSLSGFTTPTLYVGKLVVGGK
ncbi:MAG: TldD/PmbA family protein [Acholeplasmatales bacterium]|jgi:PmbA protein|nr:TldD/PmbA family protein [Acholeplasmatales bacterium]